MPDERLRLIFTCCHPALATEGQVALTLRTLCGLTTEEIARAFLVPTTTMAQRLVRAKAKIRGAAIPYRIPEAVELPDRLDAVMAVLYLVFNEGYAAASGQSLARGDLCREAIRLTRLLQALLPAPVGELDALLALMLLARRPPRRPRGRQRRAGAAGGPGPRAMGPGADRRGSGARPAGAASRAGRARSPSKRPSPPCTPRRTGPTRPTGGRSWACTTSSTPSTPRRWSR